MEMLSDSPESSGLSRLFGLSRLSGLSIAHRRGLRVYRWSNKHLRETAFQLARELEARGVRKGDRVLLWSENSPEWVAAFFACVLRGAIVVPLDGRSPLDFVRRVQRQVDARLMFASRQDAGAVAVGLQIIEIGRLGEIAARHSPEPYPAADVTPDDIVEIIFTSGTTAEPRGVCLTHRNLMANLAPLEREIQKYIRWERPFHPIRFLNLVPLSHVFGQFMGIFVPQLLGGVTLFQESLNPSEIIDTVKRERASVIVAVPRQLEALRDHIERDYEARGEGETLRRKLEVADRVHFLRRWWMFRKAHRRFGWKFWAFVSGGATLDAETEAFWRRLGYAVVQGYGMTETASIISVNHPFKLSRGSIGRTMPGQEIRLDSLGRVELLSALEDRYQIEIDEAAFTTATTLGDVERMIARGANDAPASYPYPDWPQKFPVTWIRFACLYLLILPAARLMGRVRVRGRDRMSGIGGPVLFASNHISMVDHGLILSALPARFRRRLAIAMGGERLQGWRHPPRGTAWLTRLRFLAQYYLVVALFNTFPLPQKSGFRRSFACAGRSVDRGYSVLVFPEGQTTPDGEMKPFMGGIGLLASDLNVPVVPVKIEGLYRLKQEGRYFARTGEVSVIFGEPAVFDRGADPAAITRELESRVAAL